MENDFDSVSWEPDNDSRPTTTEPPSSENRYGSSSSGIRRPSSSSSVPQAGNMADDVDLAGIGEGRLDCIVNAPMKEHDGTKDAYISYLVTTQVRNSALLRKSGACNLLIKNYG